MTYMTDKKSDIFQARSETRGGPKFQNEIFCRRWRELGGGELGKSGQNIYSRRIFFLKKRSF